jgi:hypothetical protein
MLRSVGGWISVLDPADPGEVLTGRVGEHLAGQACGLADMAQP